jgi:hypothetical protein
MKAPIPPEAMPTRFNPLVRYATVGSTLARQHTTFTVRIPRQPPPLERTAEE